ncbi:A disintegrin and metalloproteinase with thrombospondin motifs 16 isoform X2 [Homalodisca vitripennis]|uniref:A disintegrin and metalloproteinase with thrombospondin motifs 16 isoform X2 n=1 Tax=Homalodisca vitripennis TaxID=197043 RepID=UPI001EEA0FA5|nr:A disintegrin and metalloproteinase with thrombospondin motifs 16 isoform X2 [Homalodisca vitripennis]
MGFKMAALSLPPLCACFFFLAGVSAVSNSIHHHMNIEELKSVFHVDKHSDVPQYEVVRVRRAATPHLDTHNLRLRAFGQDLDLALRRTQGLFKDQLRFWTADSNSSGHVHYSLLPHEEIGDPYQDEERQAAILLHKDPADSSLLLEGTIGDELIVKPVPASVRQHLDTNHPSLSRDDDDEAFLDEEAGEDEAVREGFPLQPKHHHIVYRRSISHTIDQELSDYAFMEPDEMPQKHRSKRSATISKREAPYVIYPEILVIVDYDGYRLHGGNNVQIKRYFVSFWNGVDMRYKLLKGPKIRISIAGIIISRGRDATPYLERNRVGRDAIDSAAALTDMGKYLFRERRLPVYDIAVAVTKYDMCRRRKAGRCTKGTAGFAYVGGACVVNKRLEKVNSVAIIEDTGGFSGIIVAAHEVGHLLGAVHDGSPSPTYLGGPGAEKCRWEDGYIMSDLRHTEKGFRWSPCSVASFHHFLNGDTATCLYNSPHEDESLPRVLPGKLLTLDAQCRKDRGTSACFKDDRVCAQLFCFDAGSGYCVAYRPAAEGSPCGDGSVCSNGRCMAEHENIIPDYSQNTPTYLRRNDVNSAATQNRPVYSLLNSTTQRSEWNEFWRTASTTESVYNPSTTTNPFTQHYTTYNYYDDPYRGYTTQNPSNDLSVKPFTAQNPYLKTTKNPYNFADFGKSKYTNSQYFKTTKTFEKYTTPKSQYSYTPYTSPTPYTKSYKYTLQPYQPYTSSKTYPPSPTVADTECVDKDPELNGGMSCFEFLERYGYQHCGSPSFIRNCCAAQKYLCDKRPATR